MTYFEDVMTQQGFSAGHAPENVACEKVKYKRDDVEADWQPFHKPLPVGYDFVEQICSLGIKHAAHQFDLRVLVNGRSLLQSCPGHDQPVPEVKPEPKQLEFWSVWVETVSEGVARRLQNIESEERARDKMYDLQDFYAGDLKYGPTAHWWVERQSEKL